MLDLFSSYRNSPQLVRERSWRREWRQKVEKEELSDVSDREMEEEEREVRLRELSVSPINSDQSESFEKAATLGKKKTRERITCLYKIC